MMAFVKIHLKAARDCIGRKDYVNAKKEATLVLDYEPENYNANVFLGLALLELGELENSEQIYLKAIELNPKQSLAWQGISKLYERQENWEKYTNVLVQLMKLFNTSQDPVKCAEALQKLIVIYRAHGSRAQLIESLGYYLPESEFHAVLSTLPLPDLTNPTSTTTFEAQNAVHNSLHILEEMVNLTEGMEEDAFKREVEKRRMRLGAPSPDLLRKEVFREIATKSDLPVLYSNILDHPRTADDLRRDIDAKLLRWKERYLYSIPNEASVLSLKQQISQELAEIVDGIVLLKTPDELGWRLYFDGQDSEDMTSYSRDHIRQYITLFPASPLSSLFKGFFLYTQEPLSEDESEQKLYASDDDDPVDTMLNAYTELSDTVSGNRILAEVHLDQGDHENTIKVSKHGLHILSRVEANFGKQLRKTRIAFQVLLSTALVHFFSPKHHKQASALLDEVLKYSPHNIIALMSHGYILQAAEIWEDAKSTFLEISHLLPNDQESGLRAQEEAAWCDLHIGNSSDAIHTLHHVLDSLDKLTDEQRDSDRARCSWRIGQCYVKLGGESLQRSYRCFISALKHNPAFAPAFTSLGVYYLENSSPPDPVRSSKCFQKAFELDARETLAAKRLVEGFADDREWDLVEVVAERTIDGEGGLNAGLGEKGLDAASRYLPMNAWAWKALGIVKFHYRDYPAAIQAFQVALRVHPDDQPLWVRLGEAYTLAGRHAAAVKALDHALVLQRDDWICSYFIAEVKQKMGLFQEAVSVLDAIRANRPEEVGILALLAQLHLDLGKSEISDGFQIRAEGSFVNAIEVAIGMIQNLSGFRTVAWKIIGDSSFELSQFHAFNDEDRIKHVLGQLKFPPPPESTTQLVEIIRQPSLSSTSLTGTEMISFAIYSTLCQISLRSLDKDANATAWYDLAIFVQSWITKQAPATDSSKAKEQVIEFLKRALLSDSGNDQYWTALGNAYFLSSARSSQHAYIRALDIDAKNAETWVCLGLLYLHYSDVELANEALYRAQVLDPDNTLAWLGQFMIAKVNGGEDDGSSLLQHAIGLPVPVPDADYEYAFQVFESTKKVQRGTDELDALLPAFFVLDRHCQRRPNDTSSLHLLALVCERLRYFKDAEILVEKVIAVLESVYEETEDTEVEKRYTIAIATLGRLRLSQGDFEGCSTSFESALGLLGDKDDEASRVLKVQANLGLGLAHFYQGNLEVALGSLEEGFDCTSDDLTLRGQVAIVLSQVLWAIGTDETREVAKSRLLECIASDPENLSAINTLAGMGILTDDEGLVDAALSEITALPVDQKHELDPRGRVDYLLIQHHLVRGEMDKARSIAQHAVYTEPRGLDQRNRLASLIIQRGNKAGALALLSGGGMYGSASTVKNGAIVTLSIQAAAQSSSSNMNERGQSALKKAQRAIMLCPSDLRGWQTLAFVRGQQLL